MNDERLVTADELATWLGVDRRTVIDMATSKEIPSYKPRGRWRFSKTEVATALRPDDQPKGEASSA